MEITRQTYETFLLLYVDNELEPAERAAVEKFLAENPDLEPELGMLQQAVLPGFDIEFDGKSMLYRDAEEISPANYESYFLMYFDNELDESQRLQVEQFVLHQPHLQDEFTLLRRTRLMPDVVEFSNKAILYRQGTAERRVVYMNWFRVASAAALTGLALLLWFTQSPGTDTETQPVAVATKPVNTPVNSKPVPQIIQAQAQAEAEVLKKSTPRAPAITAKAVLKDNNRQHKGIDIKTIEPVILSEKTTIPGADLAYQPKSNNLPQRDPALSLPGKVADRTIEPSTFTSASSDRSNGAELRVQNAVYRESDEQDEEQTLYIGAAGINRNKLRGLLKKASNLFEKKLKKDDNGNTVQVANFEIKTN